jgi:UV DNA damage repair endonuclease
MKIGFACKISHLNAKHEIESIPEYNVKGTTVSWLNRQSKTVAESKLWELAIHNIAAIERAVGYVGTLQENLRCFRLGSDILPCYTEPSWRGFWQRSDVREYCERGFGRIGAVAREGNVRLSFHPGQFCCVVSDSDDVVTRSIEELEYHSDMIRWMGFGKSKLDFKLNVHLSGRRGVDGFADAWTRMSPETRNCLTLENDEYQKGIDDLLLLGDKVGIVLDIHHHLMKEHEYIQRDDSRIQRIINSWQGVRPVIHYSQSKEEYLTDFHHTIPSMEELLTKGKKAKLRAHSNMMSHNKINEWALTHIEWADIMVEAKHKNLASSELAKQARLLGIF